DKLPTEFYDKGAIYTATYLEPVGVVGEIIPFNWPPIHTGGKLAPALAAGNTVVIKPSEQAPLTVIRIVELLNTVLPPDVLVVFDDADLDRAVRDALEGGFYNKGEACTATSRILVQDGLYDAFVSQLTEAVGKLKVGRGTDPSVHVGPVVTRAQQQRVLNYIQIGIDEGAKLAVQAALPADPELSDGFWVAP